MVPLLEYLLLVVSINGDLIHKEYIISLQSHL